MKVVSSADNKPSKAIKLNGASNYIKNPVIGALVALLCFIGLCVMGQVYPFGGEIVLVSDLEAQYAPFLYLLKNLIKNAHSLRDIFYSFSLGGGKNMMATLGYYLMSPFNLLGLFFKTYEVSKFILLIMGIKIVAASANMSLFITERQEDKTSYAGALFGVLYAFSSYALCYMFQIMWLDGFATLPLLLFFVERYLRNGKKAGIIVTLFYLFLSNYYIAYMVGVYSFFYLLSRMYMNGSFKDIKASLKKIGRFVLMAVLCAMSIAVFLLPVALDTLRNSDPIISSSDKRIVQFSIIGFINQMFGGTTGEFSDIMNGNPPFIFISTFVTLAVIIFFVSKVFDKRTKIFYGCVIALFYLSLCVSFLDTAWQAFDEPNWFYHRESFVFFPFFLTMALKVYENKKKLLISEILKSSGIMLVLLFIARFLSLMKNHDKVFAFNLAMLVGVTGILLLFRINNWHEQLRNMPKLIPFLLALILVVEAAFFEPIKSSGIASLSVHYGTNKEYTTTIMAISQMSQNVESTPEAFRTEHEYIASEDTTGQNKDSYYLGLNGISLFNSNSNKLYHRFLKQLGYTCNYNYFWLTYSFAAEDTDAFLSIGSVMAGRDYSNATYVDTDVFGENISFYRNEEVLPIAFTIAKSALDFDFYALEADSADKNYFEFRNNWYRSMFPDAFTEDFYYASNNVSEPAISNGTINNDTSNYVPSDFDRDPIALEPNGNVPYQNEIIRSNKEEPIVISYDILIESSDELYINISAPACTSGYRLYVNDVVVSDMLDDTFFSSVARLGSFDEGETINVRIESDKNVFIYQAINFAYLNHDVFASEFSDIDYTVEVNEVSNGHVTMTASVKDDTMILTTIPYEEGWRLTIDGVPADITVYQEALIGIEAKPGSHKIELTFTPPGLKEGGIVSCIGVIGLIAFCFMDKKSFKKTKAM